jgi:hypothetical protein
MTAFRAIPLYVHGALEVLAAPLLFVAPFALGFSVAAAVVSIAIGILMVGLALSIYDEGGERGTLPLTAHAGFDYTLALTLIVVGAVAGIATSDPAATIFMVGFGSAHLALTTSTRFTRPLGA